MPDEKKQAEKTDEATEVEALDERPTSARSTAEAADVVMHHYAKVARPGR